MRIGPPAAAETHPAIGDLRLALGRGKASRPFTRCNTAILVQHETSHIDRCYSFRPGLLSRETTYTIAPDELLWKNDRREGRISLSGVKEVRFYRLILYENRATRRKTLWFCRLRDARGEVFRLSPLHFAGLRNYEDRSLRYGVFVESLLAELRRHNPMLPVSWQPTWQHRLRGAIASAGSLVLVGLMRLVRASGWEGSSEITSFVTRRIGPRLRGHRVARANLIAAFPEKSQPEIDRILDGMWDNLGRLPIEMVFVDRLFDYDLDTGEGSRIVIDTAVAERLKRVREKAEPAICFSAHLANWELPAVAVAAMGIRSAVVYRVPDSQALANELLSMRRQVMGQLIPAGPMTALTIYSALSDGRLIGMLADQYALRGIEVEFFGRTCRVSPAIGRLARQLDCPVYGARAIRLPGRRFEGELTEALDLPRDATGRIDVAGTMQMITSIIEGWVRQHPEQWLWLHRRWRLGDDRSTPLFERARDGEASRNDLPDGTSEMPATR